MAPELQPTPSIDATTGPARESRRRPRARRGATAVGFAACLALLVASVPAHSQFWKRDPQRAEGTVVEVSGTVTDSAGAALEGVEVVLEGARRAFSYREFRRADFNPAHRRATTDARGAFSIDWPWHPYYNHFRLSAVVPVPRGGGSVGPHQLAAADLDRRMKQAVNNEVLVQLTVQDTAVLQDLRRFEAALSSDDERRVYREQGKPDRVDRVDGPTREQTWWYFDRGAAYRFEGGRYVELDRFDPVVEPED